MGKTKVAIIDDSAPEAEEKKQKTSKKKAKAPEARGGAAKSETDKASGVVEPTSEPKTNNQEDGAKQTSSEPTGRASGALQSDEQSAGPRATEKKPQKPGKTKPRSKKYQAISKDLDRTKTYSIDQAVEMVKKLSYSKFAGTLEAHVNTAQTGIRGLVSLPYATGRKLRILAFGPSTHSTGSGQASSGQAKELETLGATVGDDKAIEDISKGKVDFDIIVVSPDWMPKIAKVAKVLGPKGLMPNPKNGTITEDLKKTVAGFQAGKTEYKTEPKAPIIHLGLGKLNQPTEELSANVKTLLQTLGKTRIRQVRLAPTMGPSVKVDLGSFH